MDWSTNLTLDAPGARSRVAGACCTVDGGGRNQPRSPLRSVGGRGSVVWLARHPATRQAHD
jgi:hypothetical protein